MRSRFDRWVHRNPRRLWFVRVMGYGSSFAAAAFILSWMEYTRTARLLSTELYILFLAMLFALLGAWAGRKLFPGHRTARPQKNEAALKALGISPREFAILELLASGNTNKEIARTLGISPNTVKTHVARLFEKLDVTRRTQAVGKARDLALIP